MSESDSLSDSKPLLPKQQSHVVCQCHRLCLRSKAAILIILWTIVIGMVYTTLFVITASFITQYQNHDLSKVDSVVTYPLIIVYSLLAVVAMFYPLVGFVADVSCGHFKVVIFACVLICLPIAQCISVH